MSRRPTHRKTEGPIGPSQPPKQRRFVWGHPLPIPRYQLVLTAAAVTDMALVIGTIMDLTRLGRAEATHRMWQAFYCGRSCILETYRERAELYVELFAERGITVVLEPA